MALRIPKREWQKANLEGFSDYVAEQLKPKREPSSDLPRLIYDPSLDEPPPPPPSPGLSYDPSLESPFQSAFQSPAPEPVPVPSPGPVEGPPVGFPEPGSSLPIPEPPRQQPTPPQPAAPVPQAAAMPQEQAVPMLPVPEPPSPGLSYDPSLEAPIQSTFQSPAPPTGPAEALGTLAGFGRKAAEAVGEVFHREIGQWLPTLLPKDIRYDLRLALAQPQSTLPVPEPTSPGLSYDPSLEAPISRAEMRKAVIEARLKEPPPPIGPVEALGSLAGAGLREAADFAGTALNVLDYPFRAPLAAAVTWRQQYNQGVSGAPLFWAGVSRAANEFFEPSLTPREVGQWAVSGIPKPIRDALRLGEYETDYDAIGMLVMVGAGGINTRRPPTVQEIAEAVRRVGRGTAQAARELFNIAADSPLGQRLTYWAERLQDMSGPTVVQPGSRSAQRAAAATDVTPRPAEAATDVTPRPAEAPTEYLPVWTDEAAAAVDVTPPSLGPTAGAARLRPEPEVPRLEAAAEVPRLTAEPELPRLPVPAEPAPGPVVDEPIRVVEPRPISARRRRSELSGTVRLGEERPPLWQASPEEAAKRMRMGRTRSTLSGRRYRLVELEDGRTVQIWGEPSAAEAKREAHRQLVFEQIERGNFDVNVSPYPELEQYRQLRQIEQQLAQQSDQRWADMQAVHDEIIQLQQSGSDRAALAEPNRRFSALQSELNRIEQQLQPIRQAAQQIAKLVREQVLSSDEILARVGPLPAIRPPQAAPAPRRSRRRAAPASASQASPVQAEPAAVPEEAVPARAAEEAVPAAPAEPAPVSPAPSEPVPVSPAPSEPAPVLPATAEPSLPTLEELEQRIPPQLRPNPVLVQRSLDDPGRPVLTLADWVSSYRGMRRMDRSVAEYIAARAAAEGQPVPRLVARDFPDLAENPPRVAPVAQEPLPPTGTVLYHGTNRPFERFDPEAPTNKWQRRGGFFFTDRAQITENFKWDYAGFLSEESVAEDLARGKGFPAIPEIQREGRLTLEGLKNFVKRSIDDEWIVMRRDPLTRITDPEQVTPQDLDYGLYFFRPGSVPRTIETVVTGNTIDLRRASTWPKDLVEQLRSSDNRFDRQLLRLYNNALEEQRLSGDDSLYYDFSAYSNSPTLERYALERDIGKIRIPDHSDSGGESYYVPDVKFIGYGQEPYIPPGATPQLPAVISEPAAARVAEPIRPDLPASDIARILLERHASDVARMQRFALEAPRPVAALPGSVETIQSLQDQFLSAWQRFFEAKSTESARAIWQEFEDILGRMERIDPALADQVRRYLHNPPWPRPTADELARQLFGRRLEQGDTLQSLWDDLIAAKNADVTSEEGLRSVRREIEDILGRMERIDPAAAARAREQFGLGPIEVDPAAFARLWERLGWTAGPQGPGAPPRSPGEPPQSPLQPEPPKRGGTLARFPSLDTLRARIRQEGPGPILDAVMDFPGVGPVVKSVVRAIAPRMAAQNEVERIPLLFRELDAMREQIVQQALSQVQHKWLTASREIRIDENGFFTRGVTPKPEYPRASLSMTDVLEYPDRYDMPKSLREFIRDGHRLFDEVTKYVESFGIPIRKRQYKEGGHYWARVVEEIRGVEKRLRTDPNAPRTYDSELAGKERGVVYSNNPMRTLQAGLDTLLRKVVAQYMGELVNPLGRKATELLDPSLTKTAEETAKKARVIEQFREELGAIARGATPFQQRGDREVLRSQLARIDHYFPGTSNEVVQAYQLEGQERAAALLELQRRAARWERAAKQEAKQARSARSEEMERLLRSPEVYYDVRGVFGEEGRTVGIGRVPLRSTGGRLFEREIADELTKALSDREPEALRKLNLINLPARVFGAGLDLGTPAIHLLPAAFAYPRSFAKAVLEMYKGVVSPRAQAAYFQRPEVQAFYQEMLPYGFTLEGTDYLRDLPMLTRALERISQGAVSGESVTSRLEAVFNGTLNVAKTEIGLALYPKFKERGQLRELAEYLNDLTGTISTRARGVGPTQRAIEQTFLFFSPRYTRAVLGILGHAIADGSLRGWESRKVLAGLLLIMPMVYLGVKQALGEPVTEDNLNPAASSFLEVELFGRNVSLGGLYMGLMRAVAQAIANPDRLGDTISRLTVGRAPTITSLATQLVTGRDYLGEPTRESLGDVAQTLARSGAPLPFWARDLVLPPEGQQPIWERPLEQVLSQDLPGAALEAHGLRVSEFSEAEQTRKLRQQLAEAVPDRQPRQPEDRGILGPVLDLLGVQPEPDDWFQLSEYDRWRLEQEHPELAEQARRNLETQARRGNVTAEFWLEVDKQREPITQRIEALEQALAADRITSEQFREQLARLEAERAMIPRILKQDPKYQSVPLTDEERAAAYPGYQPSTHPVSQFIDAYYAAVEAVTDPDTGIVDTIKLQEVRDELERLSDPAVVEQALAYINRNRNPEYVQAVRQFREYERLLDDFGMPAELRRKANEFERRVQDTRKQYPDLPKRVVQDVVTRRYPELAEARERMKQYERLYGKVARDIRRRYWSAPERAPLRKYFSDAVDLFAQEPERQPQPVEETELEEVLVR